jgi:hypothetical protein
MTKPPKNAASFSAEERVAMGDRKKELATEAAGADGEREALAKIATCRTRTARSRNGFTSR